jgi:hypothetical protein
MKFKSFTCRMRKRLAFGWTQLQSAAKTLHGVWFLDFLVWQVLGLGGVHDSWLKEIGYP